MFTRRKIFMTLQIKSTFPMMENTTSPAKQSVVNMTATTEFQKTKFCEVEFHLETEMW